MNIQRNADSIVGKQAPEFIADAIINGKVTRISSLDFYGQFFMLFFYEADFSFVCPTEMHALQAALPEFKQRNVEILGASVDPIQAHMAWLKTPQNQGGIEGITFPLIADVNKSLSRAYYVLDEEAGSALRGTFLIDKNGIVQYGSVNSFQIGRNVADLLRTIDALQFTQEHKELCPMDWAPGKTSILLSSHE
ncbi:MAG: peroxiredoxin [Candidatus Babeliaceae bacterium]|jgi:peroxiredoxin (alkyl hydroperoxide reductase subunit C)